MKNDLDSSLGEKTPAELRRQIFTEANSVLESRARPGRRFNARFVIPAAGALATIAAVLITVRLAPYKADSGAFSRDPEMIQNAKLLLELDVLERLDLLEKLEKAQWPKKKS